MLHIVTTQVTNQRNANCQRRMVEESHVRYTINGQVSYWQFEIVSVYLLRQIMSVFEKLTYTPLTNCYEAIFCEFKG